MNTWSSPNPEHRHEAPTATHRHLTPLWSRVILFGWLAQTLALIAVGTSSHVIGRPVFWLDDQRWTIAGAVVITVFVAVPIAAVIVTSYLHGPWIPYLSLFATAEISLLAALDRHRSPGAAVVLAILAGSALLFSVASFGGKYRKTKPASP